MTDYETNIRFAINEMVNDVFDAVANGIFNIFVAGSLPQEYIDDVEKMRQAIIKGKYVVAGALHSDDFSMGVQSLYMAADEGMSRAAQCALESQHGMLDQDAVFANLKSTIIGLIALVLDFCFFAKEGGEK